MRAECYAETLRRYRNTCNFRSKTARELFLKKASNVGSAFPILVYMIVMTGHFPRPHNL